MAIPSLNEKGLLPAGIHFCSTEEIHEAFASAQHSLVRQRLFGRLLDYLQKAEASDEIVEVIVDGSFITAKAEPADVDLIVATRHDRESDTLLPVDYNLISRKRVARNYHFDVLAAPLGSRAHNDYVELFRKVKGAPGLEKGLLRVK